MLIVCIINDNDAALSYNDEHISEHISLVLDREVMSNEIAQHEHGSYIYSLIMKRKSPNLVSFLLD